MYHPVLGDHPTKHALHVPKVVYSAVSATSGQSYVRAHLDDYPTMQVLLQNHEDRRMDKVPGAERTVWGHCYSALFAALLQRFFHRRAFCNETPRCVNCAGLRSKVDCIGCKDNQPKFLCGAGAVDLATGTELMTICHRSLGRCPIWYMVASSATGQTLHLARHVSSH